MYLQLEEVLNSIKEHKTRNVLTGFGVAWGILILVVLLGTGEGLQNGITDKFGGFTKKTVVIFGGQTSITAVGQTIGKYIVFDESVLGLIKQRFGDKIKAISPEHTYKGNSTVSFKENFNNYTIKGVTEDYFDVKAMTMSKGRPLNGLDCIQKRKVAVIGQNVKKILFKNEDPIGKKINFSGEWLTVVGVIANGTGLDAEEEKIVLIPYQTLRDYFGQGEKFWALMLNLRKDVNSESFEQNFKLFMSRLFNFNSKDEKALGIINYEKQIELFNGLFDGLKVFVWLIAICILLTGMVGVSNIMLVIVKERTREIGIRKALGAKKKSIIGLVLSESVMITLLSGLIGVILGFIFLFIANIILDKYYVDDESIVTELNFNFLASSGAMLILVIAGCLAGILPAIKAASINPVDAMKYE